MYYVLVYARTVDSKLPMVIKRKPVHLNGMLNLPGGKVEFNETSMNAAIRELREETGLFEKSWIFEYCGRVIGESCIIDCYMVNIGPKKELTPDPKELEYFEYYDYKDIFYDKKLMPNLRLILPLMESGARNWEILDIEDWKALRYNVSLKFENSSPITVTLEGSNVK